VAWHLPALRAQAADAAGGCSYPLRSCSRQPLPKDWRDELSPGTWVIACPSAQLDVFRPSVGRAAHAW
jgi:hypothetical protein